MRMGPGGLVKQTFTQDETPQRWEEVYFRTLKFHLFDEKHFESETGLKPDKPSVAGSSGSCNWIESATINQHPQMLDPGIPSNAMLYGTAPRPSHIVAASNGSSSEEASGRIPKSSLWQKVLNLCGN